MRFAVQQLLGSAAAVDPSARVLQRAPSAAQELKSSNGSNAAGVNGLSKVSRRC